ncbi:MAG: 50S ribosomal protein L23 [Gammaproteobacteria bacterium]|nr:50S ribosomal protein L23 [Gammaproteobacteria bacterium]
MSNEERLLKVLRAPHVSEKATIAQEKGQYVFKVASDATKLEIKKAVELMFKVKVTNVQVSNVKSKAKTFGRIPGRRKGWKKAYVTLPEGQAIDLGGAS